MLLLARALGYAGFTALHASVVAGDGVFAGVEITRLVTAGAAAFAAWRLGRRTAAS